MPRHSDRQAGSGESMPLAVTQLVTTTVTSSILDLMQSLPVALAVSFRFQVELEAYYSQLEAVSGHRDCQCIGSEFQVQV